MMTLLPWTVSAKTIVVLGDSISAGFGIEVQQGWVALLQNRLTAQHSPYVINNESITKAHAYQQFYTHHKSRQIKAYHGFVHRNSQNNNKKNKRKKFFIFKERKSKNLKKGIKGKK